MREKTAYETLKEKIEWYDALALRATKPAALEMLMWRATDRLRTLIEDKEQGVTARGLVYDISTKALIALNLIKGHNSYSVTPEGMQFCERLYKECPFMFSRLFAF